MKDYINIMMELADEPMNELAVQVEFLEWQANKQRKQESATKLRIQAIKELMEMKKKSGKV